MNQKFLKHSLLKKVANLNLASTRALGADIRGLVGSPTAGFRNIMPNIGTPMVNRFQDMSRIFTSQGMRANQIQGGQALQRGTRMTAGPNDLVQSQLKSGYMV